MVVFVFKIARITLGIVLCLAGIVLGPVPIIPGFVVFGLGIAVLARDVPLVRSWVEKGKARWRLFLEQRRRRRER